MKCIVVMCVCVYVCVCLFKAACLHYCTDLDVTWQSGRGCPLVVHYWADLQLLHGMHCYGNITRTLVTGVNAKCQWVLCTRSVPSLVLLTAVVCFCCLDCCPFNLSISCFDAVHWVPERHAVCKIPDTCSSCLPASNYGKEGLFFLHFDDHFAAECGFAGSSLHLFQERTFWWHRFL